MAQNLNFTADGRYFVSDQLTGGDSGCVAFQLNFEKAGAEVVVEFSVFPEMGWEDLTTKTAGITHPDVVSGVLPGIQARIRTTQEPTEAKYKTI